MNAGSGTSNIAELHRVYPLVTQRADIKAPHYHATAALEAEIAGLQQVGELLRGHSKPPAKTATARCKQRLCVHYRSRSSPAASGGVAVSHRSGRVIMLKPLVLAVGMALRDSTACAQDVPGVEVCTVEKSMVRRTSCLQSNVDFLQKLISKNASDNQQKLDAASRAIDDLKSAVVILQKSVSQLQTAEKERK